MSMIMKKQVMDDGRVVRLVFRTILDDEAHPFDANSYVSDQYGWIHMEEVDGGDGAMVRYKSYVHSNMAHPKRQDVERVAKLARFTWTTEAMEDPVELCCTCSRQRFVPLKQSSSGS
ncbi:Aste57867_3182 [Aphanomyces stellatus]|uniref:Aste57867_3182 protein n=1 Tax=Aphanomyces stellatus TaxID=120398 RepID=A0A485K970_9STRA|nr:hypothetical protein As57867_003173 [Aphanomyces stellatus]VFT80356.1 Aste57867_3182 [Aphanomyces stellatus]